MKNGLINVELWDINIKNDIYRPNIRISKKTPKTFNELTRKKIKRARKTKARTGRVKKF